MNEALADNVLEVFFKVRQIGLQLRKSCRSLLLYLWCVHIELPVFEEDFVCRSRKHSKLEHAVNAGLANVLAEIDVVVPPPDREIFSGQCLVNDVHYIH